jgi:hypothetical protein
MGLINFVTMEGRPAKIASILAKVIDKKCKDDKIEDIEEALNILIGVAILKKDNPDNKI